MYNITEFSNKYKLSQRDTEICKKVYGSIEKSEQDWVNELEDKVCFNETPDDSKKEEVKKKIKDKKNKNK